MTTRNLIKRSITSYSKIFEIHEKSVSRQLNIHFIITIGAFSTFAYSHASLKNDMDKRFENMDKRFEKIEKLIIESRFKR